MSTASTQVVSVSGTEVLPIPAGATTATVNASSSAIVTFAIRAPTALETSASSVWAWVQKNYIVVAVAALALVIGHFAK